MSNLVRIYFNGIKRDGDKVVVKSKAKCHKFEGTVQEANSFAIRMHDSYEWEDFFIPSLNPEINVTFK